MDGSVKFWLTPNKTQRENMCISESRGMQEKEEPIKKCINHFYVCAFIIMLHFVH